MPAAAGGVARAGRVGDAVLYGLCVLAGLVAVATLVEVVYQVINGASPAVSRFGLPFVWHSVWAPNLGVFGAGAMLYGTVVTSLIALVLAAPLGVAIGLYLALMAPPGVRAVVGPLVEMLAAIPSIVLGLWGVIVLAPFVQGTVEPFLHSVLGFIPVFGTPQTTGLSLFTAGLVLTLMIVPIVASLSRDLFLTVPSELKDGAAALGATRWEVIRGVVLPSTASGVTAAIILGLGRALGEAVAVASVIGDGSSIHRSIFQPGATLAGRLALQFESSISKLHTAAMFYLALLLLVIGVATNLIARKIAGRFDVQTGLVTT
jgi:phosphate transport system permease protein